MTKKEREEKLILKLKEMSEIENSLYEKGVEVIAGVDEVGRGPLAGPVVTACVVLPKGWDIPGLDDSKKISEKKREEMYDIIMEKAVCVSIASNDNERIDEINILEATKEAMLSAINKTDEKVHIDHILIDALTLDTDIPQSGIVKGDAKSISIAAASIVAKVTRDRLMCEYAKEYPGYSWEKNKGYGTKAHYEGIDELGITPLHRKTFLKNYLATL